MGPEAAVYQQSAVGSVEHDRPLTFATRSAVEFPIAKMVTPMMASDRPNTWPRVVRIVTTSSAVGVGAGHGQSGL